MKRIKVGIDATIGQIKRKISKAYKIPFGSFKLSSVSHVFGSNEEDLMLKEIGWHTHMFIQVSDEKLDNPEVYLAQNKEYINALFDFLSRKNTMYTDCVWNLLTSMPPIKEVQNGLEKMEITEVWFILLNRMNGIPC